MEIDGRDFFNSPPIKTVRFGGTVAETLAKHKRVSGDVTLHACCITEECRCLKRICCLLKGDSNDYELLAHQLTDPDIKVDSFFCLLLKCLIS